MLLKTKEFELSEEEAAKLANATALVSRHYNVAVAAKTMDWYRLMSVASVVYGPRIYMVMEHAKERRANRPRPTAPQQPGNTAPRSDLNGAGAAQEHYDGVPEEYVRAARSVQ